MAVLSWDTRPLPQRWRHNPHLLHQALGDVYDARSKLSRSPSAPVASLTKVSRCRYLIWGGRDRNDKSKSSKNITTRRSAGQKLGRSHLEWRWLHAQLGCHQPKRQAWPYRKPDHRSPCHHYNPELIPGLFWHGCLSHWALSGVEPSVPAKWWNSVAHGGMPQCWSATWSSRLSSPAHRRRCPTLLQVLDQRETLRVPQNNAVAITVHTVTQKRAEPCRRILYPGFNNRHKVLPLIKAWEGTLFVSDTGCC